MAGATKVLGLALAVNGVVDLDTECRATTGLQGAIAKLATAWIIDLADGDEVALFVANHSSTVDIDFQRGRIVATSVAGFGPQGPTGATGATGPAGPGVATGGATGQVLVKQSSTDFDTAWKLQFDQIGFNATEYSVPEATFVASAQHVSSNRTRGTLFAVTRPILVSSVRMHVSVAGSASSEARLGFYSVATASVDSPVGILLQDLGTISVATTGDKTITPATPILLNPGVYIGMWVTNSTTNVTMQGVFCIKHALAMSRLTTISATWRGGGLVFGSETDDSALVAAGLNTSQTFASNTNIGSFATGNASSHYLMMQWSYA
jgi:hypothetical protein